MTAVATGAIDRRRTATADRALVCARALEHDVRDIVASDQAARHHRLRLRRLARRSDAVGLADLAEAARLTVAALHTPRRQDALVSQAIAVLTLAGRAVARPASAAPDLRPVVEALRDHVRYAEVGGRD